MITLLERIQESMNKYELEGKLTEQDFYDVNESREICEANMAHIKSAYKNKIIKDFKSLYDNNKVSEQGYKYIEKEKIKYSLFMQRTEYQITFVDLKFAMKSGKKIDTVTVYVPFEDIHNFHDVVNKKGVNDFMQNWESYNDKYKISHTDYEKSINIFSPFALADIKPMKNMPKKWKHSDVVKVLANGQYTSFTDGLYSPSGAKNPANEIFGLEFIENMYALKRAWSISNLSGNNNNTDPSNKVIITMYYINDAYSLEVDLTIKPS